MAKGVNQKQKILYLRQILLERTDEKHPISMAEILEALEAYGIQAERKSIYADIETLKNFGMDIIHRREQPSGYCVVSREFELPELKLLVDAVQSSKFLTARKSEQLIRKLESLTSRYEAKQLARQVVVTDAGRAVSPPVWGSAEGVPPGAGLPPPAAPQTARMHRHRYTLKNRHHFFLETASLFALTAGGWIWFQIWY